jgi:hypothetical protein
MGAVADAVTNSAAILAPLIRITFTPGHDRRDYTPGLGRLQSAPPYGKPWRNIAVP